MSQEARHSTRRRFLESLGGAAVGGAAVWLGLGTTAPRARAEASQGTFSRKLLEDSAFAYISPLRSGGQESTCHAEVWYAWLDDSVVVTVAADRWKAQALDRGLDRARVWIGDHGRWKTWLGGRNESFRKAPHFEARVERVADLGEIETLLEVYERKYPHEIATWRDRMRSGTADGSRVLLRYSPLEPLALDG